MIYRNILTLALLFCGVLVFAQPANDECDTATALTDVTEWCSASGAYTNVGATASGFGQASCFDSANNDVWFSFTAVATDVTITVIGDTPASPGGTLNSPAVALYSGDCDDVISELQCEADQTNDIVELYRAGLAVGETYYIRVNGRAGNTGTFQLCVNNYFPPVLPGSDCATAGILCDTSPFTIQSVVGAGSDPDEAAGTCLDGGAGNSESSSTWFAWTAANNGSLTFTLTPTNPEDDLDFIVYELPNGLNNCIQKQVLRCMATGLNGNGINPGTCFGPTGLATSANDTEEAIGCQSGDDSFLAPLQLDAGTSYALLVNNFSATGNGFSMSFGGNGQFVGPNANFTDDDTDNKICVTETITFEDNSSFSLGPIMGWEWNFGLGASPPTATGQGPHTVQFNEPANISVVLRLETELGCIVSEVVDYEISACCNSINQMTASFTQTNLTCADDLNGAIDVTVSGPAPMYNFDWSTGESTEDLTNIAPGNYIVTIYDDIGCDTIFNIDVDGPPLYQYEEATTSPSCGGSSDGAIDLTVGGATPPYTFAWTQNGMPFGGNTEDLSNLPVGDYAVLITDGNGCQINRDFELRELELVLDSESSVTSPSCNGTSDGSIQLTITTGLPPYEFDLNDGNGFTDNNIIENIPAGTYNITVRDANMCENTIEITVTEPDTLLANLTQMDISCFGYNDGNITLAPTGGTAPYTYTWDPAQANTPTISNLTTGDYSVTVTDMNDCMATATTTITEPLPVMIDSIATSDNVCFGASDGELTIYPSGGSPPFQYSIDGINFQDSPTLTGLPSGAVTVTIRDVFGCDFSTDVTVSQPFELIVDAGQDVEINLGLSTNLNAVLTNSSVEHSIMWTPDNNTLSCTDCFDPVAMPPITTTYVATITTIDGCEVSDSVTVSINEIRPVYIPNAISPDLDGTNDIFMVFGSSAVAQVKEFRVFDRWGGLMFAAENIPTDDPAYGWDATYKGRAVNPGVYVYFIDVEFIDGKVVTYKGDINVVK